MSLPAAVLWDMDGTLVDTEPYWIAAEHEIVEEHGGTWSDEFAHQLVGNDLLVSARFIKDNSAVPWGRSGSSTSCWPGDRPRHRARAVAAGRPRAALGAAGRGRAQRARHDVVAVAGGCRRRRAPGRRLRRRGHRGRGLARQAAPRALPRRGPAARRVARGLRRHRGLADGGALGGGRRRPDPRGAPRRRRARHPGSGAPGLAVGPHPGRLGGARGGARAASVVGGHDRA